MTDIAFYHLTRSSLEQALPRLLGRVLDQNGRAVVMLGSPERLAALDQALWIVAEPDWLPHGATADAELQPIWLTIEDTPAPNGARFLFLADGATTLRVAEYDRVFDLFDGQDDAAVTAARARWRVWKEAGHGLAYWQQGEKGWEKKA